MRTYYDGYRLNPLALLVNLAGKVLKLTPRRFRQLILYLLVVQVQQEISTDLQTLNKGSEGIDSPFWRNVEFSQLKVKNEVSLGVSQLLGTWESQVQQAIQEMGKFDLFIDVGADLGLYPVALLKNGIADSAIAFERLPSSQSRMRKFALSNEVDVEVRGEFNSSSLLDLTGRIKASARTLWMFDVEGAETDLIDENFLESLSRISNSSLIIELHPQFSGKEEVAQLVRNLEKFYDVRLVDSSSRSIPAHLIQHLYDRPDWEVFIALSELRQKWMFWAICTPFSKMTAARATTIRAWLSNT
jgi:hypothetical protein